MQYNSRFTSLQMSGHYFIAKILPGESDVAYSDNRADGKKARPQSFDFNRPEKRNAINFEMMREIEDALADAE